VKQSDKEKAFIKDYEALLEKHGVCLVVIKSSDEYGAYAEPCFKENGKYCNISYAPDYNEEDTGYHGMGG
jgi:hypothetical protein